MLATASAVVVAGGIPVPVDIGDDNLIDPDAIAAAITHRTVGISPTQLNGRTCNMDEIMRISKKYKLFFLLQNFINLSIHFSIHCIEYFYIIFSHTKFYFNLFLNWFHISLLA